MYVFTPVKLLLLAAVLPGLFLMYKINRMDKVEKEPFGLLVECFFLGALSIIPALILERVGVSLLSGIFYYDTLVYEIILNFIVIACSEELSKFVLLKRATWNHPAFNYRFDAVIYAVFVGLGFAVFENINYVMSYGLFTALIRAITAVPAHTIFAIFMGHYYGLARENFEANNPAKQSHYLRMACIVPVLLHGFYDFAASSDDGIMVAVFWIFLIGLYIVSIKRIRKDAKEDAPLY